MSRIEELPDDFDENLNIDDLPSNIPSLDDMYAQHAKERDERGAEDDKKLFEETLKQFSKTPLFMNNLDVAGDADGENDGLEALRALQYEGSKAEVARNFKEQGNEMVQEKRWNDAKEFYSKAIAVLSDKREDRYEKGEDVESQKKEEKALEEVVFTNRALCNLELKNYRSTTFDCASSLRLNPANIKAHYRSASALLALDKIEEAYDVCDRGLKLQPSNAALLQLFDKVQARAKVRQERDQKAVAKRARQDREKLTLYAALKARNIRLRGSEKPPDLEDAAIRLSPDPLSPKSLLEFPTLFLYPLHNQSDFVKAFAEKNTIIDHLSYLLPLPWDTRKEYKLEAVDCYMDTSSGGMIKVGKKSTLLQALTSGKTEVVDGLVRIHVVPTTLAPKWIDEVKKKKAK